MPRRNHPRHRRYDRRNAPKEHRCSTCGAAEEPETKTINHHPVCPERPVNRKEATS